MEMKINGEKLYDLYNRINKKKYIKTNNVFQNILPFYYGIHCFFGREYEGIDGCFDFVDITIEHRGGYNSDRIFHNNNVILIQCMSLMLRFKVNKSFND